jgi:hypothetical protein
MSPVHRKVQVRGDGKPRTDRYITLTTTRLLATDLYLVGVIDGSGRLTDSASLRVTPNLDAARRYANGLVEQWGGVVEADHQQWLPKNVRRAMPVDDSRIVSVEPVRPRRDGQYAVRWQVAGRKQRRGKRFLTEPEAQSYFDHLIQRMENN